MPESMFIETLHDSLNNVGILPTAPWWPTRATPVIGIMTA